MALTADDRLDIYEVLVRYGFIVDDRDWPGFTRVFTPDAVIDFGGLAPIVGVEEIVRQYRDVLTHPLQHIIVNDMLHGFGNTYYGVVPNGYGRERDGHFPQGKHLVKHAGPWSPGWSLCL